VNQNFYHSVILVERAESLLGLQFSIIPSFVINTNHDDIGRFQAAHEKFRATLAELRTELTSPEEIALLDELFSLDEETYHFAQTGIQMRLSGLSLEKVNDYFRRETFAKTEELGAKLSHDHGGLGLFAV